MNRRIDVTLPEETIALIDRMAPQGNRDRVIDEAVRLREALRQHVDRAGLANLDEQLAEGYTRNAERDLRTAEQWSHLDEEAWEKADR